MGTLTYSQTFNKPPTLGDLRTFVQDAEARDLYNAVVSVKQYYDKRVGYSFTITATQTSESK